VTGLTIKRVETLWAISREVKISEAVAIGETIARDRLNLNRQEGAANPKEAAHQEHSLLFWEYSIHYSTDATILEE
jgi:hypothetical protein